MKETGSLFALSGINQEEPVKVSNRNRERAHTESIKLRTKLIFDRDKVYPRNSIKNYLFKNKNIINSKEGENEILSKYEIAMLIQQEEIDFLKNQLNFKKEDEKNLKNQKSLIKKIVDLTKEKDNIPDSKGDMELRVISKNLITVFNVSCFEIRMAVNCNSHTIKHIELCKEYLRQSKIF